MSANFTPVCLDTLGATSAAAAAATPATTTAATTTTAAGLPQLACSLSGGYRLQATALGNQRFRVSLLPTPTATATATPTAAGPTRTTPRTWMLASPTGQPLPPEGFDRDALLSDFAAAAATTASLRNCTASATAIRDCAVELQLQAVAGQPPQLRWLYRTATHPMAAHVPVAADFGPGAYSLGPHGRVQHTLSRGAAESEFYYGLGEAAGTLNRYGGRFSIGALDAMGYEADPRRGTTDPLYKHYPMSVAQEKGGGDRAGTGSCKAPHCYSDSFFLFPL